MNFIKKLFRSIKTSWNIKQAIKNIKPVSSYKTKAAKQSLYSLLDVKEAAKAAYSGNYSDSQLKLLQPFFKSKLTKDNISKETLNLMNKLSELSSAKLAHYEGQDAESVYKSYNRAMAKNRISNIFNGLKSKELKDFLKKYSMTIDEFIELYDIDEDQVTTPYGEVISFENKFDSKTDEGSESRAEKRISDLHGTKIFGSDYFYYLRAKHLNVRF